MLLWDETNLAFQLRSGHVKRVLERLDDHIQVVRHPKVKEQCVSRTVYLSSRTHSFSFKISPLSWSHHQKMVCVDSLIAFVGGIDITWGRYDDHQFRLTDPDEKYWPGKDYGMRRDDSAH